MCGIAGIVVRRGRLNVAALSHMATLQTHRGPDEQNVWCAPGGRVGFSHRRLSIIDLSSGGRQPMQHPTGDTVVCYNGEIYNYLEIAGRLRGEGARFSSRSDTEVLIEAYRMWGDRFLGELNGMFAFALYDAPRRRLLCARDRYGEKPFLYVATPDFFVFASEYKALLGLSEIRPEVEEHRLLRFLMRGAGALDDHRATIFSPIQQLLPGERLILDVESLDLHIDRYWTLAPTPRSRPPSLADAAQEFRDLLDDSVRLRLRSDVPVGSCLSGGLDSGSIACLIRGRLGAAAYHAFSGRFPGTDADEGPFIEAAAEAAGAAVHEIEPRPSDLIDEIAAFMWHNELPVASSSQYAQWCVFRLARQAGVIVLLDGQGGDELLGGYEQHFQAYVASPNVSAAERAAIRHRYPRALPGLGARLKTALPLRLRWILAQVSGRGSDVAFGFSAHSLAAIAGPDDQQGGGFSGLGATLFAESFHTVLSTLLRYGDRNSMAHSVEVRLPFCDYRLAELVFSLPPEYLMGDAQTKRLLREAMRGILPETLRTRWNKQGFVPPQDIWLQQGLMPAVESAINDHAFAMRGYWNPTWWRQAVARAKSGERHLASALWKAFIAESWQRHFVARARAQEKLSVLQNAEIHARDLGQLLPS